MKSLDKPSLAVLGTIVAGLATHPLAAADLDGCTLKTDEFAPIVAPILEGSWKVTNGPGVNVMEMAGQKMIIPLAPAGSRAVAILYHDGQAWVSLPPGGEAVLMPVAADNPHVEVQVGGVGLAMVPEAAEKADCAAEDLQRVWFSGKLSVPGEPDLDMQTGLYVINENLMSGTMTISSTKDGGTMIARRLVTFSRVE